MDYVVRTEVFEGPFDLLLHLIARQRVDIWQVSLSRITEDYLAEVRRMRELNLEVATEFLVVAATLLELKAARLLPAPEADPDQVGAALEERDLLFARLLQYRAYKQVAGLFGARLAEQAAYAPRRGGGGEPLRRLGPHPVGRGAPGRAGGLRAAAGRGRGPAAPHRPRAAGRGHARGAGPAGRGRPHPGAAARGHHHPHRPAVAVGRRDGHLPGPAPPGPRGEQLRGPGRPPGRPHRGRRRPACRPGAVQAIVGRARPGVDLRRHRRPLDRRRPGRPRRPHGRGARMTDPTPTPAARPEWGPGS